MQEDHVPAVLAAGLSRAAFQLPSSRRLLSGAQASGSQSGANRLLQSTMAVADVEGCTVTWSDGEQDAMAMALQRSDCPSVVLQLEASRKLVDTVQLPVAWPTNVTIIGKVLPDGRLPQLLMNPHGRVRTQANSHWRFEGVEVLTLSLDWFSADSGENQATSYNAQPTSTQVHVSMSGCVLRSMKCAREPENDMAHAWLDIIAGHRSREDGLESTSAVTSNAIGSISDSGWVDVVPWTLPPPVVMFSFQNTTTACTPDDDTDTALMDLVEAAPAPAAAAPPSSGCYLASDRGQSYRGQVATTESGRACLRWGLPDQPGGGNIFSDPLLRNSGGLSDDACRNPLGMLDRPWCFVVEAPYIERCELKQCAPAPPAAATATAGTTTHSGAWVKVLIVICSIAGVLLIALLLVLLMRALWGGSLCLSMKKSTRTQGRSKRESSAAAKAAAAKPKDTTLDSFSSDEQSMSEHEEKTTEESPRASVQHSTGSGRRPPSSNELRAPPVMPHTHARPHSYSPAYSPSSNHKSSQHPVPQAEMYRRYSEPQAAPGSSRLNSTSHTRSSTGDGRSSASSHGLRPTTPPLHKSHSSHAEIRSQGSPMHHKRGGPSSDQCYSDLQASDRLQQASARSPRDEAASGGDDRFALIASPTLRQIMERSSPHRMELTSNGAGVMEHHTRNSSAGKSPREGDLRQRTIEEELAYMHGLHDAGQRGMVYSVDSRSYATSSLQDMVHSAAFASGAVNSGAVPRSNTRTGTADLNHTTEASTIVLDTPSATAADQHTYSGSTVVDLASRDRLYMHQQQATAAAALAATGTRAAAAAAAVAGTQASYGSPYRRPDTERTISGSWTNSNSSPTGTLASRVAMQSPGNGASFNMSAGEGGAALETFQSDRDSHTSQYQVNLWEHDIKIGKRLGRGSFAQVFQGLWNDTAVAIKVIEYKECARDAVDPCMEASLTKELTHPNVVITYDYGWTSHEVNSLLSVRPESIVMVILMEYCNLKSLATNIRHTNRFGHQTGTIKWAPIAHTLIDILRGLVYLHDMEIIHGDIKAANVMLKSVHKTVSPVKFTAKLADLGLAQLRGDAIIAGAVGSLTHAAPELLNSRCNTPQSDIYAFGVLMYEIISGKEPFKGLSVTDLIRLKTSTDTADTLVMDAGEDRVYAAFAEIFNQCVASEPADRPTCKELFKQLRTLSTNSGLSSHDSAAHYQSIRVCPDSCGSPRKELFSLGAKAASLASQSSRYSRSPRSADAHGAAQAWANQGFTSEQHAAYAQRRGVHWSPNGPASPYTPMHMRSQLSPRAMSGRSGWRSPTATSPHSPHNSQHGSPAHAPYPDQHPFSYDHTRPVMEEAAMLGMPAMNRNHTLGSLSGGAMSPTHSEHAVPMDMRRYEPARSGSVASSGGIRSSVAPSTQTDLAGTYERINSLSARQGTHSTGMLSASGQPSVPSPHVAYRSTHVYPTGAPAIGASFDGGFPNSTAASASNGASSARMSLSMREPVSEQYAMPSSMPGLSSHSRPNSADQQSEFHRSMSAHRRNSGGVPQGAPPQLASPPGSQQLDSSVPGSMEVYDTVFHNPAAVLTEHDGGDETAPEDGDSSSDDSHRGNSRGGQRGNDHSQMGATQAALGGLDSTDSFAGRHQLNLGSVDSFNLEMGNSSNLRRLMQNHNSNPGGKGTVLADAASGPSGGPSGTSLTLDEARRVAGTTIPEASVTEGTLDAMPSVSAVRRAGGNSASMRRQGGLRRPGYRGNGDQSGCGGALDDTSAGHWAGAAHASQSSGTVSLNLWGNNNSFQNSLMHDDCSPQGQVLAGAGGTSFSTDPDTGGYPVQSIMESMRHMQSVAGNSSFMPRPDAQQGVSSGWLERPPSNAGTAHAQPPIPLSDPQSSHLSADGAASHPAGAGAAVRVDHHQQDAPSQSTQEFTTQSSGPVESSQLTGATQQTGASSLADAPAWVRGRAAADRDPQAGDEGRRADKPPHLSSGNLQPTLLVQQNTVPLHVPKPPLAGGALNAEKSGTGTAAAAACGHQTDNTNGISSSISCGPVAPGDRGLGVSPASRPPSPLAGTHTLPHTSRTGSLSQTLSHNSLSSPPCMPARQPSHSVLNKPVRAAGQSIPKLRQEVSMASLVPTPETSLTGPRLSLDTVSPASGPSQRPLTASMLQTSTNAAVVGPAGFKPLTQTPHGALRMDTSIQGVQAWLQDVPDPANALTQPDSPSSSPHKHSRRRTSPGDHSSPPEKRSYKRQRSKHRTGSGIAPPVNKDTAASPHTERSKHRRSTAEELPACSLHHRAAK